MSISANIRIYLTSLLLKHHPRSATSGMSKQECTKADIQLSHSYALWYAPKPSFQDFEKYGKYEAQDKVARNLNENFPIDTLKKFWANYNTLPKPSSMPYFHKISFMRKDMKPFWSEPALQANGGVVTFILENEYANDVIDYIVMAIIGDMLWVYQKSTAEGAEEGSVEKKPNALAGCSFTRRRKRDMSGLKEWFDCHIYLTDCTDDCRLFQSLTDDLEENISGFKMSGDAKFTHFAETN